jgi:hypothetical protein
MDGEALQRKRHRGTCSLPEPKGHRSGGGTVRGDNAGRVFVLAGAKSSSSLSSGCTFIPGKGVWGTGPLCPIQSLVLAVDRHYESPSNTHLMWSVICSTVAVALDARSFLAPQEQFQTSSMYPRCGTCRDSRR